MHLIFICACNGQVQNNSNPEADSVKEVSNLSDLILEHKSIFPDTAKTFRNAKELFDYLRPLSARFLNTRTKTGLSLFKDNSDTSIFLKNAYNKQEDILIMKHIKLLSPSDESLKILAAKAPINTSEKIEFFNTLPEDVKKSAQGRATLQTLKKYELSSNTGYDFIRNITGKVFNKNGQPYPFNSIIPKSKETLLIYGASWCKPCIIQERIIKKLYAEFQKKGIGIIGICFDDKAEAFTKYLDREMYPWQCFRMENGFENPTFKSLGYKGVPANVFLDSNGKIQKETHDLNELLTFLNISIPEIYK